MTQFTEGGLTAAATFGVQIRVATPNRFLSVAPQAAIITGEDGNRYFVSGRETQTSNGTSIRVYDADTGVQAFELLGTDVRTDSEGDLITPPSGWQTTRSFLRMIATT